jgi:predicted ATPase
MSKIKIKNFGPIKGGLTENDGWIDIKKFTVFIGDQGSGKSTVAKLISIFTWIEKALNRGDGNFNSQSDILKAIAWQRISSYHGEQCEIEYVGDQYRISYAYKSKFPIIEPLNTGKYEVPKIMYVPAERNFLSTIQGAFNVTGLPGPLATFAEECKRAQYELDNNPIVLPFRDFRYQYDSFEDISYVIGTDYKIDLLEASSGLHSLIPLYIVSRNLSYIVDEENDPANARINANQSVRRNREISEIMLNKSLTSDEKSRRAEEVYAKYHNKCFINIVEEPEQNLFPVSQKIILESLVEFNNKSTGNKLIITTHSPYIINYISLAVKAFKVQRNLLAHGKAVAAAIGEIVPLQSLINPDDLVIYELNERDGSIFKLDDYKGIPSDENYLNDRLAESNELFAKLQEIEKGWQ